MKKEKICNIVIVLICFLMLFVPTRIIDDPFGYVFVIGSFVVGCKNLIWFDWLGFFVILFSGLTIALMIANIVKPKMQTKISSTVSAVIYVILWTIGLVNSDLTMSNNHHGEYLALLLLYIALLLTIVVLTALQYIQYIPPRRSTKAARLEQRIAELEQQVDELKKDK